MHQDKGLRAKAQKEDKNFLDNLFQASLLLIILGIY